MIVYDGLLKKLEDAGYNTYKLKQSKLISQESYRRLIRHEGDLTLRVIDRLCKAFDCQPGDLITWKPDKEDPH